ncbi:hypothetical protein PG996_006052 [Apiospora saccharicola]|uniref:Uncharacterized protein n=1 Tax=Apiospora saccharicola TaxID=335842 RepID=A0ABR1VN82_9PEZI
MFPTTTTPIQIHVASFLALLLPLLVTANGGGTQSSVKEWSAVKSLPQVIQDYVQLINDFSICRHCSPDLPDARWVSGRPVESLTEITDQLLSHTVPQLLGILTITNGTSVIAVGKKYDSRRDGGILAGDMEKNTKSWYVLKRMGELHNKLATIANEGTVYGRAAVFGQELERRFNGRFLLLNATLSRAHANMTGLWQQSYEAETQDYQALKYQLERRQDWVSREVAWMLVDFMSSMSILKHDIDDCFQDPEKGPCRSGMPELVAFLEEELIPFLRTIHGVAWSQLLPHRHKQFRDTFAGWFIHGMSYVVDFEGSGLGKVYQQLEVAIFKLQRHADSLRKYQREDPTHLAERIWLIRHSTAKVVQQGLEELELHTTYMTRRGADAPGQRPQRFVLFDPDTVASIQRAMTESAQKLFSWKEAALRLKEEAARPTVRGDDPF